VTTKGKTPKIILFIARGLEFVTFVRSPEMSTNGYFMPEIETLEGRQVIKHLFLKVELFNGYIWRAPLGPRIVNLHEENVCFSQIIFAKHEDILLRDYAPNTKLRKLGISKW
jgi:hypothetical protein